MRQTQVSISAGNPAKKPAMMRALLFLRFAIALEQRPARRLIPGFGGRRASNAGGLGMARQVWCFAIGFRHSRQEWTAQKMIGSDEELREAEERLERESKERAQVEDAGQADALNDIAPSLPEDVAKKILRDAFKHFPIPGKK
jgi:hypothetical protein